MAYILGYFGGAMTEYERWILFVGMLVLETGSGINLITKTTCPKSSQFINLSKLSLNQTSYLSKFSSTVISPFFKFVSTYCGT
jgi:hypothetical protein